MANGTRTGGMQSLGTLNHIRCSSEYLGQQDGIRGIEPK